MPYHSRVPTFALRASVGEPGSWFQRVLWVEFLPNSGVPGTGESALVGDVASDRPGARHQPSPCGLRCASRSVFCGGREGVFFHFFPTPSPLLLHFLAWPLAELDGGELVGCLLILDADGELLFAAVQGVADGAGAADLDGVGFLKQDNPIIFVNLSIILIHTYWFIKNRKS